MVKVPLENAIDRLKALHRLNILDTLPEKEYDDITRMAAYICNTPIAFISFIDDERQWFKSQVGFTTPEVPGEFSFCFYAIQDPENIKVVQDATKDERFKDNIWIKKSALVFCASVPLVDEGFAIGTLCVMDHVPRTIENQELEALGFLARCIMDKLQDRKDKIEEKELHKELESEIGLLYKAINSSSDHLFIIDPESMKYIEVNNTALKELGYTRKEFFQTQPQDIKPLFTKELLQKKYVEIINSPTKSGVVHTLHKKKNGDLIDVEIHFNSIKYNNKDIIISSVRDITDKVNAENKLRANEKKYRDLFDTLPDMVYHSDSNGIITIVNPACFEILGYAREELFNTPAYLLYNDPADREKMLKELKKSGQIKNYRSLMKCKNGDTRLISSNVKAIYKNGKFAGVEGVGSDITEKGREEQEVIRTKDFYETILNSITEDIAVFDDSGRYLFLNKNAIKDDTLRAWMIGKTDYDYCIEKNKSLSIADDRFKRHQEVNTTGLRIEWLEELKDNQGNIKYVSRNIQPFTGTDGKAYKVGFGLDVTKLKITENLLIERKNYLNSLINSIPDIIFRMDRKGTYLDYKADNKDLLAIEPDKLLNKTLHEIFPEEIADFHLKHIQDALKNDKLITYEYEMIVLTGETKSFEARINKKENDEVIIIARDITERKLSESKITLYNEQLKEREESLQQLISSAPDAIVVCDAESNIILWNPKCEELFGWTEEEIIGKNLSESIIPPQYSKQHKKELARFIATGKGRKLNNTVEITALNKKGEEFFISITLSLSIQGGEPVFIAFMRDISILKLSELELRKSEKKLIEAQQIAKVGSYERNTKTGVLTCSNEFLKILGINTKNNTLKVEDYYKIVHPDDLQKVLTRRDKLLEDEALPATDYRIITPGAEVKYISSRTTEMQGFQKDRDIIFGTIQDITERVMFEKKLYYAIIDSEEKERKRIAAELHDGVLQYLAATKLTIETVKNMISAENSKAHTLLDNGTNLLLNSLDLTRKVSHDLMPATLYEEGLCIAVEQLFKNLNAVDKINYTSKLDCDIKEPEQLVAVNLFRIIQEFVRNSQKHSGAENIHVEIIYKEGYLEILIRDDGKGYLIDERNKNGIGILNMVKRIQTIGGTFTYDTAPGKGVKLMIKVLAFKSH